MNGARGEYPPIQGGEVIMERWRKVPGFRRCSDYYKYWKVKVGSLVEIKGKDRGLCGKFLSLASGPIDSPILKLIVYCATTEIDSKPYYFFLSCVDSYRVIEPLDLPLYLGWEYHSETYCNILKGWC